MWGFSCVFYGDLYPNEECYDEEIATKLKILLQARKIYAYGDTVDFFTTRNCIGFVRSGDASAGKPGCVVVLSNASESETGYVLLLLTFYVGVQLIGCCRLGGNSVRMHVGQVCAFSMQKCIVPDAFVLVGKGWSDVSRLSRRL